MNSNREGASVANTNSLREKVYAYLSEQMMGGNLVPGTTIHVRELSQMLNVSRTPLREALIKLEIEGFVTIKPQSGVMVRDITPEEVVHFYQIIGSLEATVLTEVFNKIRAPQLKKMEELNQLQKAALDKGRFDNYYRLNLDFHSVFLNLSPNSSLLKIVDRLKRRMYDFPRRKYLPEFEMLGIDEHVRLMESFRKKNLEAAVGIIRNEQWGYQIHKNYLKQFFGWQTKQRLSKRS